MALDGIVISNLVYDLRKTVLDCRIAKIAQPEPDELLLTIKGSCGQVRLAISASASLPLMYLTSKNKPSPLTAPNFCMLLRKHIANGKITNIYQPAMERIVVFEIEHLDELGDLCHKKLIVELMGKRSNIIFCTQEDKIIDSIKHISAQVSSFREVLPGRDYFIPATVEKLDPFQVTKEVFLTQISQKPTNLTKALYQSFTGFSPLFANELCFRSGLDGNLSVSAFSKEQLSDLFLLFEGCMEQISRHQFSPCIVKRGEEPVEFSSLQLTSFVDETVEFYSAISEVLELYYAQKNQYTRMRQKSSDLRRIVSTALERVRKKYELQKKQLKDTEKREKYRIYGEMLHTYGYELAPDAKKLECVNYYTNEPVSVPLDTDLTPAENAKKYFDKYAKLKRTFEALTELTEETKMDLEHLESVATALDLSASEADLAQIKEELMDAGYIKRKFTKKKQAVKSKPYHYQTTDGYDIYIGKNNFQNDELTFKFAEGNDWWFHAKGMPGSHVVVKTKTGDLPDHVFEDAAALAAYYSKGQGMDKVEIDYLQKKNVKKPNKSKPGFVVYYTNYSLAITPGISNVTLLS